MLLAGLAGSLIHCTGMCGPFVLGQVIADTDRPAGAAYGEWHRLAGAALAPYHLGRLTTYVLLGAIAGEATGLFASTAAFGWLSGTLLVAAALLLITQALGVSLGIDGFGLQAWLSRLAGPLAGATGNAARYGLGVLLGFLPCGLLYGALAAAAGTGSGVGGGLAMAAFALGTMPALIAVGWGGVYGLAARETDRAGPGTVYTFALGGSAKAPAFVDYKLNALLQGVPYDKSQYDAGTALYVSNCAFCHGVQIGRAHV